MECVASTLHTTSEHGVSSITNADAHTSAVSSRLNGRPRQFKWNRPFRRKTKSGFCVCAITFQLAFTSGLCEYINPLTPNDPYRGRTALLTSKFFILYNYSTNISTEYFKHGIYSPFRFLQNTICFIVLTYLVPVLFTFYLQVC